MSRQDWIDEGFRGLSRSGISALKAEVLAVQLGATKGSFYWHFKDMNEFKSAMLGTWLQVGTHEVVSANEKTAGEGLGKLRSLVRIVSALNATNELGGLQAEPAVREWARTDAHAAKVLKRVDEARIDYMAGLFRSTGESKAAAKQKATLLYSVFVGQQALCVNQPHDMLPTLNQALDLLAPRKLG